MMPIFTLRLAWTIALLLCMPALAVEGPVAVEEAALRILCSRGLSESAVRFVRARMAVENDRSNLAWWTMREMDCLGRWAMQDAARADQLWNECTAALERYRTEQLGALSENADPRWPWLQWQLSRCNLMQAQSLLAIYLAAPNHSKSRDQALELVRKIVQQMDELSKDIKRRQPLAARQKLTDTAEAPADQLRNLFADTQLVQTEALMIRWQLYPEGSPDRTAALGEVRATTAQFLSTVQDGSIQSAMLLALAIADLEAGDPAAAQKLEQLMFNASTAQIRMMAGCQLVRYLASQEQESRLRAAMDQMQLIARQEGSLQPLLSLCRMEVSMLAIQRQSNQAERQAQISELIAAAGQLGNRYGDYWKSRAEALFVGKLSADQVSNSQLAMELLMAEVRQLASQGDEPSLRSAAQRLLKARDIEAAAGRGDQAIAFARQAAALLYQIQDWPAVIEAVRSVTLQFANKTEAAAVHRLAVEAQMQQLRNRPEETDQRQIYVELLREQLVRWPDATASGEVKDWLRSWTRGVGQPLLYTETLQAMVGNSVSRKNGEELIVETCVHAMALPAGDRRKVVGRWLDAAVPFADSTLAALAGQAAMAITILSDLSSAENLRSPMTRQENWEQFEQSMRSVQATELSPLISCAVEIGRCLFEKSEQPDPALWNSLPPMLRAMAAPALVDLLDSMDSAERQSHWKSLSLQANWHLISNSPSGLSEIVSQQFEKPLVSALSQAALWRIGIWLSDASSMTQLKQISEKYQRDGQIQLLYATALSQQGDFAAAKKIATQVSGHSVRASSLHWSARWALMRFQLESGERDEAKRAAALLLASQSELPPDWLRRFTLIANAR